MLQNRELKISVIIDVFRAFTTACYVLQQNPKKYIYANKTSVLNKLVINYSDSLFIGKNEIGTNIKYHLPNSPTRVKQMQLTDKVIFHRTEAGSKGVLNAKDSDIILAASFVNATATVNYLKKFPASKIAIIPMGHEAITATIEDDLCAQFIRSLLNGQNFDISPFIPEIEAGPGKYFFLKDQWQYPKDDFQLCLAIDSFNFAVEAVSYGEYAILSRC